MYKYATLYRVEDPDQNLQFPGRVFKGMGHGALALGGLYGLQKGVPWAQEKLVRGIGAKPNYVASGTRAGLDTVLGSRHARAAAFALPLAYNLFFKED